MKLRITAPEWNKASARTALHDVAERTQSTTVRSGSNTTVHTTAALARADRTRRRTCGRCHWRCGWRWDISGGKRGRRHRRSWNVGRKCIWSRDRLITALCTTTAITHAIFLNLACRLSNTRKTSTIYSSKERTFVEAETGTFGLSMYLSGQTKGQKE